MHYSKILSYITMLLLSLGLHTAQAVTSDKFNDMSVLVISCDKYSQMWKPFFALLDTHWPSLKNEHTNVPIYLVASKQHFYHPRVQMINIPNEVSWSDNLRVALDKIHSKYILVFLDDYWLKATVDEARLAELLNLMRSHDAAYMQLYPDTQEKNLSRVVTGVSGVRHKGKFQKYRASLQLAIWETNALRQILRSGESAWDFEMAASIRSSGYPKDFYTLQSNPPILYLNASNQGHITPEALDIAKKMHPNYISTLPILNDKNWDLKIKHAKHRITTIAQAIKRNTIESDDESYRYSYDLRE